jgi:hypothetical protein
MFCHHSLLYPGAKWFSTPYALLPNIFPSFVIFVLFCTTLVTVVVLQFDKFSRAMSRSKYLKKYSEPNPRLYRRVVRDGIEGVEKLVTGSETTTFREACLDNWQFKSVDKKSDWMVRDERGNDVTDQPLSRFDGILFIEGEYPTMESSNESDEYTSIRDSVEYYD